MVTLPSQRLYDMAGLPKKTSANQEGGQTPMGLPSWEGTAVNPFVGCTKSFILFFRLIS